MGPISALLVKWCCNASAFHMGVKCQSSQGNCRGHYYMVPGSWNYNYPCNKCLSPLKLRVWIPLKVRCTLCDKVCQWFFLGTPFSSTNKTDCHDIAEKLLKALLNTTALTQPSHITGRIAKMSTMDNRLEAMAIQ